MRRIELKLRLAILAVTPCTCVIYIIIGALSTQVQCVKKAKRLMQISLNESILVCLSVIRRPRCRTWSTTLCRAVICLYVIVSPICKSKQIKSSTELLKVIVGADKSVTIGKITLGHRSCSIRRKADLVRETKIQSCRREISAE